MGKVGGWFAWLGAAVCLQLCTVQRTQVVDGHTIGDGEPDLTCYTTLRKIILKRTLQASVGVYEQKHSDSTVASLAELVARGCALPLVYDGEHAGRRSITLPPQQAGRDATSPLSLMYLVKALAARKQFVESEQILEAMLTNNSYVDLEYNLALMNSKKGREAPLEDSMKCARSIADPDAAAPAKHVFYTNMLLASRHISATQNFRLAVSHAKSACTIPGGVAISTNSKDLSTKDCIQYANNGGNCHLSRLASGKSETKDDSACSACGFGQFASQNSEACTQTGASPPTASPAATPHDATNCHPDRLMLGSSTSEDDSACAACSPGQYAFQNVEACVKKAVDADNCDADRVTGSSTTEDDSYCDDSHCGPGGFLSDFHGDNVARVMYKRALVVRAIDEGKVTRHNRPKSSIVRNPAETGGWLFDGIEADPPIETVEDAFPGIDFLPAPQVLANVDGFQTSYLKWNRPAIIGVGLIDDDWRGTKTWMKKHLASSPGMGDANVQAQLTPYSEMLGLAPPENVTMKTFIETHMDRSHTTFQSHASQPYYIFQELPQEEQPEFSSKPKDMLSALKNDYVVPKPLQTSSFMSESLALLSHFFVGAKGSGSHLHAHVATFNALVYGRKRWYLVPPEYGMQDTYTEQHMPIEEFASKGVASLRMKGIKVLEFLQQAGEVIVVPSNWLHAVFNLEDSVGISHQLGETSANHDWEETFSKSVIPFKLPMRRE